jgi:hypothetical protein
MYLLKNQILNQIVIVIMAVEYLNFKRSNNNQASKY